MQLLFKRAFLALFLGLFSFVAYAQQTVTGTVKDSGGEPMIGVTGLADGQPAAITDIDGNFSIANVKPTTVIKLTYVGYVDQQITVGNKTTFNVTMKEDKQSLDEVVVVGYGTMKKSDLTGSIASVDTEKLNAKGATSIVENLQGSVPGVNITQSSSRAGGGFDIEIRGKSTFGGNKTPLYVVDGIICEDINFLNPQDIERIDILKDASSTAIYGSRATNGVVIVTTKGAKEQGGKAQQPTITYDGYYGITKAVRMPDFMNGSEFAQYRMFRYENAMTADENGNPTTTLAPYGAQNLWGMTDGNYKTAFLTRSSLADSYVKDIIANDLETNWRDLFLRTASQQNHYISVSGNGGNVNYHFGAGYQSETGIYKGDAMERFNLKGSIDSRINDYISAGLSFNGAYTNNRTIDDTAVGSAFRLNPLCRAYDDDGEIILYPGKSASLGTDGDQFTGTANPLLDLVNSKYSTKKYQVLANLYLELRPVKDVVFKTTFSPSYVGVRDGQFEGSETTERAMGESHAYAANRHKFQWTWDNQINYNHSFGDHNLGVMGLFSASKFNQEGYTADVYDVPEQILWWNLGTAKNTTTYTIGSSYTEWSMLSWAARVNYNYKGLYYFTGTVRWDGSSRFADGHRWGSFPSLAAAWRISEEKFMESTKSWLSNLKLRASFGTTGNNYTQGTNYATSVVAAGGSYFYGFADGSGQKPYYPSGIVNKELTWEKTTEYNIGLDFGFLRNRITGTIDWYTKNSKDLLVSRQLPYEAGGVTVIDNVGKVRNTGFEFSLTTVNIQNKDWNWTTSLNFSTNKNKVVDTYGNKEDDIENSLFIGESINALYNYKWTGIVSDKPMTVPNTDIAVEKGFTPGETVLSRDYYYACYGWGEGMPIVDDLNGDGAIDQLDKTIIGKSNPSWTGSFNSTLTYKGWDFAFSIYTKQNYEVYAPFYKQYMNYGDRGMMHAKMDFYIPDGALLSCDYDEDGNRINEVYQQGTHYGKYPFPTNQSETAAGVGTYAFSSNGKDGADSMDDMKTANKKGAPYQVVDASYWKVKNISLGYTFPKSILGNGIVKSLRLYVNITNPFVFGTDYEGFDPEWAGTSLAKGGPSTTTYQFGANIKF